ncbi:hypothetical protein, partial [Brevibacillus agri]
MRHKYFRKTVRLVWKVCGIRVLLACGINIIDGLLPLTSIILLQSIVNELTSILSNPNYDFDS